MGQDSTKGNVGTGTMKSTLYRPKKKKRSRKHGFLKRSGSKFGKRVLTNRRRKGRKRLTV